MSVQRLFNGKYQSFKANGAVNNAGTVTFKAAGTSNDKATYSDYERTSANANPVVLDSEGRADIYLDTGFYDVTVKNSAGTTILTLSNVTIGSDATTSSSINEVPNGSFEASADGTTPTNWTLTAYTNGTVTRETADNNHGQYAMKFVSTGSGGGYVTSAFIETTPQEQLTLEWLYKSTAADVRNDMDIFFYDASQDKLTGSASTTSLYSNATSNTTTWAQSEANFTPPTDARYLKVQFTGCNSADVTAGTTWLDNVRLRLPSLSVLDEDDFASDSATLPPSQQSTKVYIQNNGFSPYKAEFFS